ncbi:MAG TPA: hypothetical protein VG962_10215 [Steroidobacteraceae bacterium]|nr:hypothetical protein [Steroidobacteraceae bacterium]
MEAASLHSLAQLKMYCESTAKQLLFQFYEFVPFCAYLTPSNEIQHLAASGPAGASVQELYELLHKSLVSLYNERKLMAYALTSNVTVPAELSPPFPDGIRVHMETSGYSRFLYTPYRVLPYPALLKFLAVVPVIRYAELIAEDVRPAVFPELVDG